MRCAIFSHSVVSDSETPMICSPPGSSVHEDSPGRNTRVGFHAFLQKKCVYVTPKFLIYSPTTFPFGNHKFVFYVCESVSVL